MVLRVQNFLGMSIMRTERTVGDEFRPPQLDRHLLLTRLLWAYSEPTTIHHIHSQHE